MTLESVLAALYLRGLDGWWFFEGRFLADGDGEGVFEAGGAESPDGVRGLGPWTALPGRRWARVEDALRRSPRGLGRAAVTLRAAGLWDEAAALGEPGRLWAGAAAVAAGRVVTVAGDGYPGRWRRVLGASAPPAVWSLGARLDGGGERRAGEFAGTDRLGQKMEGRGGGSSGGRGGARGMVGDGWSVEEVSAPLRLRGAGSIGVVGSRTSRGDILARARRVGAAAGCLGLTVWSGGAWGVDRAAVEGRRSVARGASDWAGVDGGAGMGGGSVFGSASVSSGALGEASETSHLGGQEGGLKGGMEGGLVSGLASGFGGGPVGRTTVEVLPMGIGSWVLREAGTMGLEGCGSVAEDRRHGAERGGPRSVGRGEDGAVAALAKVEAGLVREGRTVLSVAGWGEPFRAALAMERNTLIYAACPWTVVVAARLKQGGTWTGATEALRRGLTTVLVGQDGSEAARALVALGGVPLRWWEDGTEQAEGLRAAMAVERGAGQGGLFGMEGDFLGGGDDGGFGGLVVREGRRGWGKLVCGGFG